MPAPKLLLLPGTLCDERVWQQLLPTIDPGGHAAIADVGSDDSIAGMAKRALGGIGGDLVLIGFSLGAIVALEMARQDTDRVAGLALLSVNPGADLPERAAVKPRQQAEARAGRLGKLIEQELLPIYFAETNRRDPDARKLVLSMGERTGAEAFVRQSEALRTRADLWPLLPSLTMPALLLVGAEDLLCPPAWHAAVAERMSRATLEVISGAGHMLPIEQPTRTASAIAKWLVAQGLEHTDNQLSEPHTGHRVSRAAKAAAPCSAPASSNGREDRNQ